MIMSREPSHQPRAAARAMLPRAMLARAKNLANAHVFEGGTDEVNKQLDHYLAVKREDLQRVAKKYFITDKVHILHYPAAEPKGTESK